MSKAERTKQFIVEQAALKFNEKGIAGTSIDEILEITKVSKGCFYGHFKSKEELTYASVDYLLDNIAGRRDNAISKQKTAIGKIGAFMDNNKKPINSFIEGGCPIVNLSTEADDTSPVIKAKIKTMVEKAIAIFSTILQNGIDNGELSADMNPEKFATKMFISIEGGNAICRVLNSNKPMQIVIESLKAELEGYRVVKSTTALL